jgi:protease-4
VDKLGGLPDAIASAAVRAKLGQDYKVRYIEKQLGWKEQLMADLMRGAVRISGGGEALPAHAPAFLAPARALARQAEAYASFNDPNGVYAYCPYAAE